MTTFSLSLTSAGLFSPTASPVDQTQGAKNLCVPDDVVPVSGTTLVVNTAGGRAGAMAKGTPFLARTPDGGLRWCVFDAERSTAAYPILRPL